MQRRHIADRKALQTYFNSRLLKIVAKHGKHMEGWDEVLHPDLPKSAVVQSWRGQESLWRAAREGYQGILSAGYYLDLMYPASYHYAIDPMVLPPERVERLRKQNQPVPAELTGQERRFVLGGEAAMWEELATSENVDAKLWPRLAAIAERFWSPQTVTDPTSMYARLDSVNLWLEWLGLTQRSNLELMRRRLAGPAAAPLLARFSEVIEPVKGYARHPQRYGVFTPLNTLVDSIPPESDAARQFRESVDRFLAGPKDASAGSALASQLRNWSEASGAVRPVLQASPNLADNLPVVDALASLCQTGLEALARLSSNAASAPVADNWKKQATGIVKQASERKGDFLIQIAPGIQRLVEAVSAPTP
jgi:hexosaminidase